jgi:hypothetical protein
MILLLEVVFQIIKQMSEVLVSKRLFQEILERIKHLKPIPIGSG